MLSLAGVTLSTCLLLGAAAPPQSPSGPVLIGVWYGGGSRRPPETADEPERERDAWRRDLETIRSLGFNSVVTWVRWDAAEPARGQYRLDALEQIAALAAAMGLRVRVRLYEEPAPAWAAADRGNLPSHAAAFAKVVAARAPLEEGTAGQIDVGAAGTAADLRLWGWAALARGSRAIAFHAWPDLIDGDGRPSDRARTAGDFAGVITRNLALFNPLGTRKPPPAQLEPDIRMSGATTPVHAVFLESMDVLVLIAMNYGETPATVTLTFARGTKQEFWQNLETGEMVSFSMAAETPSLTHTFAPRDAIVLTIRKRSPYDRDRGLGVGARRPGVGELELEAGIVTFPVFQLHLCRHSEPGMTDSGRIDAGTACAPPSAAMSVRPRIVVASPDPTEVALLSDWLTAESIEPVPVRTLGAAIEEVESRAFDVLIADVRFAFEGRLHAVARTCNPRAPVVVVGGPEAAAPAHRHGAFHLDRPLDHALLLCHVTMAMLEGRPARRSPRKRIPRFDAIVDGARAFVIDVSNEGLRFEFPQRFAPAPQFGIRIPLVGIALTVRRVWVAATRVERASGAWCGVELFEPHPRAEEKWRAFVGAVPSA